MKDKLPAKLSNGFYYSDDEMTALYREASDKRQQIKVLAELNACTQEKIIAHLIEIGIDKRSLPRANKAEKAAGEKKHYNTVTDKPKKPRKPRKKKTDIMGEEPVAETQSETVVETTTETSIEETREYKNATLVGSILQSQAEAENRYNVNLASSDETIATNESITENTTELHASRITTDALCEILRKMMKQKEDFERQLRDYTLQIDSLTSRLNNVNENIDAVKKTIEVIENTTKF